MWHYALKGQGNIPLYYTFPENWEILKKTLLLNIRKVDGLIKLNFIKLDEFRTLLNIQDRALYF